MQPPGTFAPGWNGFRAFQSRACSGSNLNITGSEKKRTEELDDMYWIVSERDMPLLKEYALTQLQYNRFEYWATGKITSGDKIPKTPLFKNLFEGRDIGAFFAATHTREEYLQELARKLSRCFPAFLDMANMDRMLGGSFLPGIEVGLEAGKARNWSLLPRRHQAFFPTFDSIRSRAPCLTRRAFSPKTSRSPGSQTSSDATKASGPRRAHRS